MRSLTHCGGGVILGSLTKGKGELAKVKKDEEAGVVETMEVGSSGSDKV